MGAIQLSVVIITFNEEKNIARCLDSIQRVADDVVVVDSFSSDKTKEICLAKNVRFISHAFEGHIEQKNWAISQANFPYVLSLDADEALTDEAQEEILKLKNDWKVDGVVFNRLTNYCGSWIKHGGWYPDRKLRLWDSRKGSWQGVNPHDEYILERTSKIYYLKQDILHYSYYSVEDHIKQVNYFTTIAAKAYFEKKGLGGAWWRMLVSPIVKFMKSYFFQLGILDGYHGWIIAVISAHATFLKYVKVMQQKSRK